MSEKSRHAGRSNWRARERKLRAKYREKIAVAVIVSLIVGMIGGIVVDKLVLTKHADTAVTPVTTAAATTNTSEGGLANLFGDATEAPVEETATVEVTAEATAEPEVTAEPEITDEPAETKSADEVFPEETTAAEDSSVSEVTWDTETETVEAAPTLAIGVASDSSEETAETVETAETGASDESDSFSTIMANISQSDEVNESSEETVSQETEEVTAEEPAQESEKEIAAEPTSESGETPTENSTENTEEQSIAETAEATAEATAEVSTEASTDVPTDAPTEAPTSEPTPAPEQPEIVPYGTAVTLTTDINSDGSAHTVDDGSEFENVSITLQVKKYLDFDYYDRTYGSKYNLKGGTAAVVLEMTLNGYTGTAPIIPQNFLLITFCDDTGEVTTQGVQLIDAEIAGNTGVAITSDVPATIYKRYFKEDAGKEMTYMVVTTYNNGIKKEYRFEIIIPADMITPEPTADPSLVGLSVGSRGDDVTKLQEALIEAGYLSGTADGIYGTNTAEAVKLMQKQFGLEETGDAGPLFLTYLYMDKE